MAELSPDETALLCGGPERVAQCALLGLYAQGRVRVSRVTRRVTVVRREADDEVQAALLDEVPDSGFLLGHVLEAVAESAEVLAVARGLHRRGLLRRGLRGRMRPTSRGRAVRRRLRADAASGAASGLAALSAEAGSRAVTRLAVLGTAAVEDEKLRQALEMDNPKPIKLPRDWAKGMHRDAGLGRGSGADTQYTAYYDGGGADY